jgi:uncharacterized protein (TIGR02453 family)
MQTEAINPSTLKFLKDIAKNNDREWFNSHKDKYLAAHENMCGFIDRLIFEMNKHDSLENGSGKASLFRIYNDVRFSKDKSPYKARFAFNLSRATKLRRGGYYANIKPGESFLACGFWNPNPPDLARIRQDIHMHDQDWRKLLSSKKIQSTFGELQGEVVPTVPRGFSKDHVAIDLIRHKQFFFKHELTDQEVLATDFVKKANTIFKSVRPFFDYMSEVLTTNADGESI